jgi:hypothetical protein
LTIGMVGLQVRIDSSDANAAATILIYYLLFQCVWSIEMGYGGIIRCHFGLSASSR